MASVLIADDEPLLAADLARRLCLHWPQAEVVAVAANGVQAVAELGRLKPQFAFLDIRMPGLNGIEVARAAHDTRVVFVTAYDEYAVAAFETAAADYLLKPVSDARLAQCVLRLQQVPPARADAGQVLERAVGRPERYLAWLTVGLANTTRLVPVNEVMYFRSSEKYTEVVTGTERHLMRMSLRDLLAKLDPDQFAQIHRGTVVNLAAIARVERDVLGRFSVYLKSHAAVLGVSRGFAGRFRQM